MTTQRKKFSVQPKIIPSARDSVKAKLVAAGVPFGLLARHAGMPLSTVSRYLSGDCRGSLRQMRIYVAFCSLTHTEIGLRSFWGDLLADEEMNAA